MKKLISLLLVVVMCVSLCACGKSEALLKVESQIAMLNSDSTCKEIRNVYDLYRALPFEEREVVENIDTLAEYCDVRSGKFVLTESMLDEIKKDFDEPYMLGVERALVNINLAFEAKKRFSARDKGWNACGNIVIASERMEDPYTYTGYGSMKIQDVYGAVTTHKVEITYFAEYSEEEELGYAISYEVEIY